MKALVLRDRWACSRQPRQVKAHQCLNQFMAHGLKLEEGALVRKAVDASLDANVRTPEIQVADGSKYGTKEVGAWIVDWINKA